MDIKPKRLTKGDTIGIIAPSSPVKKLKLKRSIERLKQLGYKIKLGKHVFDEYGYLAGIDQARVDDINEMFTDPEVDAIFCARGGVGSTRIIAKLDYESIRKHPKIFVGYSDITALLNAIHQQTGLITFHAPMVESGFSHTADTFSQKLLFQLLSSPKPLGKIVFPTDNPGSAAHWKVLRHGIATGKSIAGCISVIQTLLGTPYEFDLRNKLFFWEDVDEEPYRIDRMLAHFKLTGKLNQVTAILTGKLVNCKPKIPHKPSLTLPQILRDILSDLNVPVVYNLGFGHGKVNFPIPLGIEMKLDTLRKELIYLESAVS
ncbi:MAG: LD-carboxypeptidase [bacterium]|nr:LD-carboxypeptidase [bacterium]